MQTTLKTSFRRALRISMLLGVAVGALAGCRGKTSRQPPIHFNPNMDSQDYLKAQSESEFFADGRGMRTPPEGTVARGFLKADDAFYRGVDKNGEALNEMPKGFKVKGDVALLDLGEARYNIYCAPCHDVAGYGKGPVTKRPGLVPPPSYHQDRIRNMPVGYYFDVISNGVRTMPSYKHQIPAEDRWAIAAYIRVLQRSQNGTIDDVPAADQGALQ